MGKKIIIDKPSSVKHIPTILLTISHLKISAKYKNNDPKIKATLKPL